MCNYSGHIGANVKNIFHNPNIRSYVSYNDKQLHIWKDDNAELVNSMNFFDETESHAISCVTYSKAHMLYFAISTDFKLYLFNEHLLNVGWVPLDVRLVTYIQYIEHKQMLVTGGIDGCYMFKFFSYSKSDPR